MTFDTFEDKQEFLQKLLPNNTVTHQIRAFLEIKSCLPLNSREDGGKNIGSNFERKPLYILVFIK